MAFISGGGEAETRVQETADDAALSKISAIRMGYFNDPFMSYFVRKAQRRSPLINRGYFARVAAVDLILRRFLAVTRRTGDGRGQIVSLGCGMDSTFFRLWADGACAAATYFEVDFPEVTARKAGIIKRHPLLQACVAGVVPPRDECVPLEPSAGHSPSKFASRLSLSMQQQQQPPLAPGLPPTGAAPAATAGASFHSSAASPLAASGGGPTAVDYGIVYVPTPSGGYDIRGSSTQSAPLAAAGAAAAGSTSSSSTGAPPAQQHWPYRLVTADLRDVAAVQASLTAAGIDVSVPTLFLSECVLVYLEPEESCAIIAWAARTFQRSTFVTYEQIRPNDAFGQVMARNLEERGYSLRGLHAFPDLASQTARYRELGYASCTVCDMNDVYYRLLPRGEVARAERLELFDEVEEWHLMSSHYCIAVAVNELPPQALRVLPPPASAAAAPGATKQQHGHKDRKPQQPQQSGASVLTDMPAPPPKLMPTAPSAMAPGSSAAPSAVASGGPPPPLSSLSSAQQQQHAELSPKDLAMAVVQAHEAEAAEASARSRSLLRHFSTGSMAAAAAAAAPSAHHGAAGSSGGTTTQQQQQQQQQPQLQHPLPSPSGRMSISSHSERSRSRSRSRSVSLAGGGGACGGDLDMVAAFESASGTSVEAIEQRPPPAGAHTHAHAAAAASQAGGVGGSSGSLRHHQQQQQQQQLEVGGGGTLPPTLVSPTPSDLGGGGGGGGSRASQGSGGGGSEQQQQHWGSGARGGGPHASSLGSSLGSTGGGGGGGMMILHTHGGSVHVPPGLTDGLSGPDFRAIAAAEGEMTSARHLRVAVGMDVAREISAAADAARTVAAAVVGGPRGAADDGSGGGGHAAGGGGERRSRASSFASTVSSVSMSGGGQPHATPYGPALEASKAAISVRAQPIYSPHSIEAALRPSLADVLLPLELWQQGRAAHNV